jgi:hypothetical protein
MGDTGDSETNQNKNKGIEEDEMQPTRENRENYELLQKIVAKRIKNVKRKEERELLKESQKNNRKFTKYIKWKTKARKTIGPLRKEDGQLEAEDKKMADILNDFFVSVFTKEDLSCIPVLEKETAGDMDRITIAADVIRKKIKELRIDSAPGPDGITPRLLRSLGESIILPLELIFKKSLETSKVLGEWKQAVVIPISKKVQKGKPETTDQFPSQVSLARF